MRHYYTFFLFLIVFVASIFNNLTVFAQLPNLQRNSTESFESFNNLRGDKSHARYDSIALDSLILAKMNTYNFPGLSACVVKDDQIIWKGAFGYADFEHNLMVTDSTLFHIASVSKTVTGTALMQLWEKGLFGLDHDINNYLPFQVRNPAYPNDSITFRMLLTHTSSIREDWNFLSSLITWGGDSPIALDSFLVNYLVPGGSYYSANNYRPVAPGSTYEYSPNVGVALIGYLVDTLSNNSFEQYCQDSIFVPLGMNETSWFLANLDTNNIAMPYYYSGGIYHSYGHYGTPFYPAGQLRTSAIQFSRFLSAFIQMGQINGVRILDSATVALMTTVQDSAIEPTQCLIWFKNDYYIPDVGMRTICGHQGGGDGVSSLIVYTLETGENVGAIVLANGRSDPGIVEIGRWLLAYGILNPVYIEDDKQLHKNFTLNQNYPNPFNPVTTIEFTLPKEELVELKVYNILGKEISTLVSEKLNQGNHTYTFDGKNLASGIYYYQLTAGDFREVKKMILLR